MSDYTGHVTVGGPAGTRTLDGLTISKIAVGPMTNNAYLLTDQQTGTRLLIDAANDAADLLALIGDDQLATVVTTHRHRDHWHALADVVDATGAGTVAHADDAEAVPVRTGRVVVHGDTVQVGESVLDVIHLRGHTPGSIALSYRDRTGGVHVFTGDSLFRGGPGKTAGPTEFATLMDDLTEKIFTPLPDSTWIYPGHGDDTTLGAERPQLAAWRSRGW